MRIILGNVCAGFEDRKPLSRGRMEGSAPSTLLVGTTYQSTPLCLVRGEGLRRVLLAAVSWGLAGGPSPGAPAAARAEPASGVTQGVGFAEGKWPSPLWRWQRLPRRTSPDVVAHVSVLRKLKIVFLIIKRFSYCRLGNVEEIKPALAERGALASAHPHAFPSLGRVFPGLDLGPRRLQPPFTSPLSDILPQWECRCLRGVFHVDVPLSSILSRFFF